MFLFAVYRRDYLGDHLSKLWMRTAENVRVEQMKKNESRKETTSHSREYKGDADRHFVFANDSPCVLHQFLLLLGQTEFLV